MARHSKKMKERPESERPYEKCLNYGAESLTDGELLAVILRNGAKGFSSLELAWDVLDKHPVYKGLAGLYHLTLEDLKEISGIGNVKAIEILCILELSRRLSQASISQERDFGSPESIAAYYMESMRHLDTERVLLLLIDQRHHMIQELVLSEGTSHSAFVSVKDLFKKALRYGAEYVILLHNHPSGEPQPSKEDLILTERVRECGDLLGIPLADHIVIGDQCYVSMREENMM